MLLHIHMAIGPESNAFGLQQWTLAAPARGCASLDVHDPVAGEKVGSRCISQCAPYHP